MSVTKNILSVGIDNTAHFWAFVSPSVPSSATLTLGNAFFGLQSNAAINFDAQIPENSTIASASITMLTPASPSPGSGTVTCEIGTPLKAVETAVDPSNDNWKRFPFYSAKDFTATLGPKHRAFKRATLEIKDDVGGTVFNAVGTIFDYQAIRRSLSIFVSYQKFTISSDTTIEEATWTMRRVGSLSGVDFAVEILADSSNYRAGTRATDTILATSDLRDGNSFGTGGSAETFTFSGVNLISLPAGDYWVRVDRSDKNLDFSNYVEMAHDNTFGGLGGWQDGPFHYQMHVLAYPHQCDLNEAALSATIATTQAWIIPLLGPLTFITTPDIALQVAQDVNQDGYHYGDQVSMTFFSLGNTGVRRFISYLSGNPSIAPGLNVTYSPASRIVTRTITLGQGDDHLVTNLELDAVNEEFADSGVVWTVSSVTGGQFEVSDVTVTSFTQGQVDAGDVFFQTDGSNVTPATQAVVSHPSNSIASRTYPITFVFTPLAPSLDVNQLTLVQGDTVPITAAEMLATDSGQSDGDLVLTVSSVTGGQFENTDNPAIAITTWVQSLVTAGKIIFIDDGNLVAPSYDLSVTNNATLFDGPDPATITFLIAVLTGDVDLILTQQTAVTVEHAPQTSVTVTRSISGSITVVRTPLSNRTVTRYAATAVTMTLR